MGAPLLAPGTGYAVGAGISALGGALGGQPEQHLGNLHAVNPMQRDLYSQMMRQYMGGAGDFGFGSAVKQGKSQLQQMMADRGVKVNSGGLADGLYASMIGSAGAGDAAARRDFGMNLLRSPLQIAQTTGANFIPGSPSWGGDTQRQIDNLGVYRGNNPELRWDGTNQWGGGAQPRPQGTVPTIAESIRRQFGRRA